MLWNDNDWRTRLKRLVTKVGASPVLPVLTWGKVVESVVASGPLMAWLGASAVATVWFVIAEDLAEYVETEFDSIQDYMDS
jgi:hypothetical protein